MRLQTLTAKFPTERPPDPANESGVAVGAATGAHIFLALDEHVQAFADELD
jgi:hypothetical protein